MNISYIKDRLDDQWVRFIPLERIENEEVMRRSRSLIPILVPWLLEVTRGNGKGSGVV